MRRIHNYYFDGTTRTVVETSNVTNLAYRHRFVNSTNLKVGVPPVSLSAFGAHEWPTLVEDSKGYIVPINREKFRKFKATNEVPAGCKCLM